MFISVGHDRIARRFTQLLAGLVICGFGIGLTLQSGLGVPPWDVLHHGLSLRFGLSIGVWAVIVSALVLLLWIPLREPFGVGTILNAVIIGVMIDVTAWLVPPAAGWWLAWPMVLAGTVMFGLGSGMYIGARLGPGPRDGLMTAIARRGLSIRLTRSVLEIVVLVSGILLGGSFGVGTVIFALAIGPLVQFFLPRWSITPTLSSDPDRGLAQK